jgi:hypothetical protein
VVFFGCREGGIAAHFEKPCFVSDLGDGTYQATVFGGVGTGGEAFDVHDGDFARGHFDGLGILCEGGLVDGRLGQLTTPAVDVGERAARCAAQNGK